MFYRLCSQGLILAWLSFLPVAGAAVAGAASPAAIFPGGLSSVVGIAAGDEQTCILSQDTLYCWGGNSYGETLGKVSGFKNAKQVVAGGSQVCVLDEEGVWCYGQDAESVP